MPGRQPEEEAERTAGRAAGGALSAGSLDQTEARTIAAAPESQSRNAAAHGLQSPALTARDQAGSDSVPKPRVKPRQGFLRRLWQRAKRTTKRWRVAVVDHAPPWMRRLLGPIAWYADMLVIDHGIFRLAYLNRHRLSHEAWRSAQPAPHNIRAFGRRGIRTIINLRGERLCGSYWLEQATCERKGIKLVNFQLRSRAAPTREEIKAARDLFERVEYPILLHCKSGADRVGLMSALYRLFREGAPPAEAKRELSLRYGHIRQADTGILDRFFEKYLEDSKQRPMPFMEWVETVYDPDELKREFRASGWARRLVDQVLKRE